jgi:hypothetical protein
MKWALSTMVVLFSCVAASAETYCRSGYLQTIYNGANLTVDWTVTAASGRRVQNLMQTHATTGCSWSMQTLGGMNRPIQVTQQPRLGTIKLPRRYQVFYRADQPGTDAFAIRVYWIRDGKQSEANVNFNVKVVSGAI